MKTEVIVMISGAGTTLNAILNKCEHIKVVGVISSTREARGIKVAKDAQVDVTVVNNSMTAMPYNNELYYRIITMIEQNPKIRYIVLAGYMKIIPKWIIQKMNNEHDIDIINIHPSLLPKYKGLDTHHKVLYAGDREHGMTIHYVNEEVDGGDIIFQKSFEVNSFDTVYTLEEKVKRLEQFWYPIVLDNLPIHKGTYACNPIYIPYRLVKTQSDNITKTAKTELDKFKDNLEACGLGYLLNEVPKPPSDAQKTIERQLGSYLLEEALAYQIEGPAKEHLRTAILNVRQAAALLEKQYEGR